ncbi:Oidioi.mRNA.OKI2018_I69.chr2.g5755.t1.cds [Oikopleura dioica]|uniref:Oidioi.mRNA.OKI2018_I69.chr2.g5755.t1.cds n=2 Tax=Oikopleura dioica TaxID=34765 RepID=A0ABN7T795_OIKDI|nr:Oidioi.mRNA.OKI2018_I69.chr2.g5755.t1.cds [Oikopleura dioica]
MTQETCLPQKVVMSKQVVDFAAKIRVRTNVRLLDVEVEADCYCEDDRRANPCPPHRLSTASSSSTSSAAVNSGKVI